MLTIRVDRMIRIRTAIIADATTMITDTIEDGTEMEEKVDIVLDTVGN